MGLHPHSGWKTVERSEVSESAYWRSKTEKEDKNPNAVWKIERIKYAASTHVKDKARANTLIAESDQILLVYNMLSKAHDLWDY